MVNVNNFLGIEGRGKTFRLANDIDLTEFLHGSEFGWLPIGRGDMPFEGNFEGEGHKITGLWLNRPHDELGGLFGYVVDSRIENLGIEIAPEGIHAYDQVGGLAGLFREGTIRNCYVTGAVSGLTAGGLVGRGGSADNFFVNIEDCYTVCEVRASSVGGGFVGDWISGGEIQRCHSSGSVSGYDAGGFVGVATYGSIVNCYSRSDVVSDLYSVGGFAGVIGRHGNIFVENCYSTGSVPNDAIFAGGFAGINNGEVMNCFFDVDTSGHLNGVDSGSSVGIYGRTTAEMMTADTFIDAGWDFVNVWGISPGVNDGYPFLRFRSESRSLQVFGGF
ncbi:MAG: hypothetical protein FWH07_01245 [Oscillospiraceae bacterium]|nr:hypothetical protein [Oscillospiraceae bacterium]